VRPLIQLSQVRHTPDRRAGLRAVNAGLGPALITSTEVYFDGAHVGQWNLSAFRHVFAGAPREPAISALFTGCTVLTGKNTYLLLLDPYDDTADAWFWDVVANRLRIEIHYESLYGGEDFHAVPPPL
jgi:hypothetical protein